MKEQFTKIFEDLQKSGACSDRHEEILRKASQYGHIHTGSHITVSFYDIRTAKAKEFILFQKKDIDNFVWTYDVHELDLKTPFIAIETEPAKTKPVETECAETESAETKPVETESVEANLGGKHYAYICVP